MSQINEDKYCIKCGKPLVEGATFCTYCGTKLVLPKKNASVVSKFHFPKIKLTKKMLAIPVGIIGACIILYLGTTLISNGLANQENFIAAKKWQVIPWINEKNNAYIQAGYDFQTGEFEKAKDEFYSLLLKDFDYKSVKELYYDSCYEQAIQLCDDGVDGEADLLYHRLTDAKYDENKLDNLLAHIVVAKYKSVIKNYKLAEYQKVINLCNFISTYYCEDGYCDSEKYKLLSKICLNEYTPDFNELVDLFDFENTKDVCVYNQKCFNIFMEGTWKDFNGNIKLRFDKNGKYEIDNLPRKIYDGYYCMKDGTEYEYQTQQEKNTADFEGRINSLGRKFKVWSEDYIEVYCYKDGKTYSLYRS